MNATDARGVTPLHLALSRLRMLGERKREARREDCTEGEEKQHEQDDIPTFRKKEILHVRCTIILLLLLLLLHILYYYYRIS